MQWMVLLINCSLLFLLGSLRCSENMSNLCRRFEFSIPKDLLLENVVSAEAWIYKNNNIIRAYQVREDNLQNTMSVDELNHIGIEKIGSFWSKYAVFRDSIYKNKKSENILTIEVVDDRNDIKIPFLVLVSEVSKAKNRQKRSSTCAGNSPSCCKETFHLSFKEIGWDDWILHPEGYDANFCRGSCLNDLSTLRFHHSEVLLRFIQDNKDTAEEKGISMCCTPSVMSPLMIVYRTDENIIYQKSIENMQVEACNCA